MGGVYTHPTSCGRELKQMPRSCEGWDKPSPYGGSVQRIDNQRIVYAIHLQLDNELETSTKPCQTAPYKRPLLIRQGLGTSSKPCQPSPPQTAIADNVGCGFPVSFVRNQSAENTMQRLIFWLSDAAECPQQDRRHRGEDRQREKKDKKVSEKFGHSKQKEYLCIRK